MLADQIILLVSVSQPRKKITVLTVFTKVPLASLSSCRSFFFSESKCAGSLTAHPPCMTSVRKKLRNAGKELGSVRSGKQSVYCTGQYTPDKQALLRADGAIDFPFFRPALRNSYQKHTLIVQFSKEKQIFPLPVKNLFNQKIFYVAQQGFRFLVPLRSTYTFWSPFRRFVAESCHPVVWDQAILQSLTDWPRTHGHFLHLILI